MGEADPTVVYRESKTVADILKLVRDIPMYPATEDMVSTDADISALPPFTEALTNMVCHGVVAFALQRMSAYKLGQTVITMPELLREIAQRRLRPRSLTFLKQGNVMNSEAWVQRYGTLAPFLADVARSVLDDIALVGLAGTVMRMTQRREETARTFAARLAGWCEVTQLLADTMPGCPSISPNQLLYQFWSGLRLRQTVMDRLMDDRLNLQLPEEWERLHPNSTALQHVITVATKAENAEKLVNPRPVGTPTPTTSRTPLRGGRSPARLNAVQDLGQEPGVTDEPAAELDTGADLTCGLACPDEAKKKAWVADAPARLARRRRANDAQVAALEMDLDDLEDEADARTFSERERPRRFPQAIHCGEHLSFVTAAETGTVWAGSSPAGGEPSASRPVQRQCQTPQSRSEGAGATPAPLDEAMCRPYQEGQDDPQMVYRDNHPELCPPPPGGTPRHRVPRRPVQDRMRSLSEQFARPVESYPLVDSGEDGGEPFPKAPPFKLRPEVPPSTSRPAACPARVAPSTGGSPEKLERRKHTGKPRIRLNRADRERHRQELEVRVLGDEVPGSNADSISDRVRAWRELSHPEHVAAAALADEDEKWVDAWVPEGWRSLFRVHQWNQREREAAEEALDVAPPKSADPLQDQSDSQSDSTKQEELMSPTQPVEDSDSDSERLNFTQQMLQGHLEVARHTVEHSGELASWNDDVCVKNSARRVDGTSDHPDPLLWIQLAPHRVFPGSRREGKYPCIIPSGTPSVLICDEMDKWFGTREDNWR
ncbi:hypothetical protein CYMTET_39341 [Cymbomonas tetramitiformis]|uniref:Uncharacterized protein n=1 Tax=Cymbomonas tetramitiformis TaxID=36881 RepID=A0AAE0CCH8_9CHLO|nr:hypothetical protein CYMTET_39341 [Cymbomonas tetramitiformis]